MARVAPASASKRCATILGGFDFRGDQVAQPVASFSGGEKARLALALIVWQRPNLLLLDEPTNHLDIEMREALAEALVDFEGALVIVVAHDRHLLAAATDQWLLVADGARGALRRRRSTTTASGRGSTTRATRAPARRRRARWRVSRRGERRAEAERRQRESRARKPFEKTLAAIDAQLEALGREASRNRGLARRGRGLRGGQSRAAAGRAQAARGRSRAQVAVLEDDWLWTQARLDEALREPGAG